MKKIARLFGLLAVLCTTFAISLTAFGERYGTYGLQSSTFTGKFYNQLDQKSREVYDDLYRAYCYGANSSECILYITESFSAQPSADEVNERMNDIVVPAFLALEYDHPEMGWLHGARYSLKYDLPDSEPYSISDIRFSLRDVYTNTGEKEDMDAALDTAWKYITDSSVGTDAYDIVLAIHDYLCLNVSPNTKAENGSYNDEQMRVYDTAYSAFYSCNGDSGVMTTSVGYARGFKALCDRFSIPCAVVTGDYNGSYHGWNCVQIEGGWYAVDCVLDDKGSLPSEIDYDYFLAGAKTVPKYMTAIPFEESHVPDGKWSDDYEYEFAYPVLSEEGFTDEVSISLGDAAVEVLGEYTYTGKEIKPVLSVRVGGKQVDSDCYNMILSDNLNAGTAKFTVYAKRGYGYRGSTSGEFLIEKATPVISWEHDKQTLPYTGKPAVITPPEVTLVNNEAFDYRTLKYLCDDREGDFPTDAGEYTITAIVPETDNYRENSASMTLIIDTSERICELKDAYRKRVYDGQPYPVPDSNQVSVTGGNYAELTFRWAEGTKDLAEAPSNAGVYTLYIECPAVGNYKGASFSFSVEITHASVEDAKIVNQKFSYTGKEILPDIAVKDRQLIQGTDYSAVYKNNKYAGEASMTVTGIGNYVGFKEFDFTIEKAVPSLGTVTCPDSPIWSSVDSDDVKLTRTDTSVPGRLMLDKTVFTTGTRNYGYTFTPHDNDNYAVVKGTVSITVKGDALTSLTVKGKPKKTKYVYGEPFKTDGLEITAHYNGGASKDVTQLVNIPEMSAGSTAIILSYTENDITISALVRGLTVSKKALDISKLKWQSDGFVFNGKEQQTTLTGDIPEELTISAEGDTATNAGRYSVKAVFKLKQGLNKNNYKIVGSNPIKGTWTIAKAPAPAVKVDPFYLNRMETHSGLTVNIGALFPANKGKTEYTANLNGLVCITDVKITQEGVLTFGTKMSKTETTESMWVTVKTENYETAGVEIKVDLSGKATVKITGVSRADRVYNGQPQKGYTGNPGGYDGDFEITYWQGKTLLDAMPVNVGSYSVVIAVPESDPDYRGSLTINFTINKATIKITADSREVYLGKKLPKLSYEVSGLAPGEKLAALPQVTCDADSEVIGYYTVKVSGAEVPATGNYENKIIYVDGLLTVRSRYSPPANTKPERPPVSSRDDGSTGSSGSGGSGSGTGSSTPEPEPVTVETVSVKDNVWTDVVSLISSSKSGALIIVNMGGSTNVPMNVVNTLRNRNITLELKVNDRASWILNGRDISFVRDLNLAVEVGGNNIPTSKENEILDDLSTLQVSAGASGDYGMTLKLQTNIGFSGAGKFANLYYLNPLTNNFELVAVSQADSTGNVLLPFTHASDYVIAVDDISRLYGDADNNMKVDALDAAAILKHVVGTDVFSLKKLKFMDMDGNGIINAMDAVYLLKNVVGVR